MNEKILRIGVLGCADIADRLVLPSIVSLKEYRLVAVAARDMRRARLFSRKFGCAACESYEDLLSSDSIDIVYIPLPPSLHREWGTKALERGKHVLLEKPFSTRSNDARELIDVAKRRRLAVFENFMFVHHSQCQFIKNAIGGGEIGEVRQFRSSFGFPPLAPHNIRYKKEMGGGALLDAGVYPLKALRVFLGDDFVIKGSFLRKAADRAVDIEGAVMLVNTQGVIAHLSFGFDNFYQCNVEFWGSKGKLTADRIFTAPPSHNPRVRIERHNEVHEYMLPADNHCTKMLLDVHRLIDTGDFEANYGDLQNQIAYIQQIRDENG